MTLLYLRRNPAGYFEAFVIRKRAAMEAVHDAVWRDSFRPDWDLFAQYTMSDNHAIIFLDGRGGARESYSILGDHFILLADRRYHCTRSLGLLTTFVTDGTAQPVPSEQLQRIPVLSAYRFAPAPAVDGSPSEDGNAGRR